MPRPGDTVTVVVRNESPARRLFKEPATITYRGIVVPTPSWYSDAAPVLTITSDAKEWEKEFWPFRVIAYSHMVSLNGKKVLQRDQKPEYPKHVRVQSSNPKKHPNGYVVTLFGNGTGRCTCEARVICRHIKDELRKDELAHRRSK